MYFIIGNRRDGKYEKKNCSERWGEGRKKNYTYLAFGTPIYISLLAKKKEEKKEENLYAPTSFRRKLKYSKIRLGFGVFIGSGFELSNFFLFLFIYISNDEI